eukprot:CAMPEP_0184309646 /NCGR_PEP_ID=MMETSP1049-20130417/17730_1 /TAXON_ID=77928 /ORGANISM="Proteomonas sulcata, Strain CCMP704" /LENGTH=158 /DNA_ID=CAMNT_0026622545 /DNA_START=460 /DNA_END=936 /DNA_ORIENTATION=-
MPILMINSVHIALPCPEDIFLAIARVSPKALSPQNPKATYTHLHFDRFLGKQIPMEKHIELQRLQQEQPHMSQHCGKVLVVGAPEHEESSSVAIYTLTIINRHDLTTVSLDLSIKLPGLPCHPILLEVDTSDDAPKSPFLSQKLLPPVDYGSGVDEFP